MGEGQLHKRIRETSNKIPIGVLDELHKRRHHGVWLPDDLLEVLGEAKADFPRVEPTLKFSKLKKKRDEWFERWLGS